MEVHPESNCHNSGAGDRNDIFGAARGPIARIRQETSVPTLSAVQPTHAARASSNPYSLFFTSSARNSSPAVAVPGLPFPARKEL
jgi:hypothetical protein